MTTTTLPIHAGQPSPRNDRHHEVVYEEDDLSYEDDAPRSKRSRGAGAWLMSFLIHAAILLLLAALHYISPQEQEKVPLAHQPIPQQQQIEQPPEVKFKEIEVEVEVTVESVVAEVSTDVVSEIVMDTDALSDAAIAASNQPIAMAMGAGSSGGGMNGSGSAFSMPGGGGGSSGGVKGFLAPKQAMCGRIAPCSLLI